MGSHMSSYGYKDHTCLGALILVMGKDHTCLSGGP